MLKPLHDAAQIKRVVVSTYQSVAGAGKAGMVELLDQTKAIYGMGDKTPKKFTKQIAFNVIPHIDVFMEDSYTKEEWKMIVKLPQDPRPDHRCGPDGRTCAGVCRSLGIDQYRV
ncbi:MAG: Asd/ArgC dimerization domain-containing protein [Micavibrio sp.]|nr:Asd/ArgC dimerization domain-containing protein [Micavibrio sp.]